ncbi:MAG TPA: ATP-binding protein [Solirubrobacteraceae bacterium]|nr:ATP-binding protein [Solirubrobacteraceae bacterium]
MKSHLHGFVGREAELTWLRNRLDEIAGSGKGQMLAVRGRRGVGKSTLIEELLLREEPPHAFFSASKEQPSREAFAGFLTELERSTLAIATELAAGVRPDSWEAALRMLATTSAGAGESPPHTPICLVIDELPWLAEQESSIEGLLQTIWDRQLKRLPILIVLIGSDLHMMEALERYDRPLHGRVRPVAIEPLDPAEVADMTKAEPTTALDAYCVVGGFPQLASTWRMGDTVPGYLERELSDPTSPLIVTGERIIRAELPPNSSARAVLAAVGAGETGFTKVLGRSGIGRTSLSTALRTLTQKRILDRHAPFGSSGDTKLHRYTVTDPYLRFWLRFIAPALPVIERRRGDLACERIMEGWSAFRGHAIEPIVRLGIEHMLPDTRFADARCVSSYWTRTNHPEVDLVGADREREPASAEFVGSIKWRDRAPFSRADAGELAAARPQVPLTTANTPLVGVSRSGFAADAQLDVKLGPGDLLAAWGADRRQTP